MASYGDEMNLPLRLQPAERQKYGILCRGTISSNKSYLHVGRINLLGHSYKEHVRLKYRRLSSKILIILVNLYNIYQIRVLDFI